MDFRQWKCLNFDKNFIEVCSQGSHWQYSSIGSDNGLAPNKRKAIMWTKDVLGCRRIYSSFGLDELTSQMPLAGIVITTNLDLANAWWRHEMETFSTLLAFMWRIHRSPVNSCTKASDVELRYFLWFANKRLSKQSWSWWFETPPRPLWRHMKSGGTSSVNNWQCRAARMARRWRKLGLWINQWPIGVRNTQVAV